jgi:hypothetical protein
MAIGCYRVVRHGLPQVDASLAQSTNLLIHDISINLAALRSRPLNGLERCDALEHHGAPNLRTLLVSPDNGMPRYELLLQALFGLDLFIKKFHLHCALLGMLLNVLSMAI